MTQLSKMIRSLIVILCVCPCLASEISAETLNWSPLCSLDQVLDKLAVDERIELSDGIKFVKVNESTETENGRSAKDSVFSRVKRFFSNYELQLQLSDFFERKQDITDAIRRALVSLNELQEGNEETSRGKGHGLHGNKKGGNAILMMATMMGGTMAALGFGALAMLVMKALTVSSMALLLSAVLGLRRLLRRPDDDAGFNRISYIPVHAEHRKRRSLQNMPYRAYVKLR